MLDAVVVFMLIIIVYICVVLLYEYISSKNRIAQDMRAAVLNIEELEKHAGEVAETYNVSSKLKPSYRLLPRLEDNYRYIIRTYRELNNDDRNKRNVIPAAEWLLDNFYVIEEQVKEIRMNFPRGYYGALPSLTGGILKGFPRVYGIALELISHTEGKIDEKVLVNFIKAYQKKTNLTSGELWAIPIILRIAIVENIRFICSEIHETMVQRNKARKIACKFFPDGEILNEKVYKGFDILPKEGNLSPALVEHLFDLLRKGGADMGPVIHFMDERLLSQDTTANEMIEQEHRLLAKQQVSMGNSITSLRLVSTLDWKEIFETLSSVEQVLRTDPSGVYASMDFASRDYYRHEIESMARCHGISEASAAKKAVECARDSNSADIRKKHVGYYIVSGGRKKLEEVIECKAGLGKVIIRFVKHHPQSIYLLSITLVSALLTYFLALYYYDFSKAKSIFKSLLIALLLLFPASELGVGFVNWLVTHILHPSFLPKLELENGIPEESAAMVVVPALLPNVRRVNDLIGQVEVYYLANMDKNLYFAILGDYTDAREENMPGDGEITDAALKVIKEMNRKYAHGRVDIFYYFGREREYNPCQRMWMGWERKRGKLLEFNRLLRGCTDTTYSIMSCDCSNLPRIKYIITLDADTELPRGTAKKLIGAISHPLNAGVLDDDGTVTDGYGILQPRVTIGITSAMASRFSRIFAGQSGIDPYTTAVSDVYMDLFGEGIYTGKGIYDIDVFQSRLDDAMPENSILSHDLIEGCYARAGLVTDIELVDGFPSKYSSYMARLHRWVRGDWQLLPWLLPYVRDGRHILKKNPLSAISKWKIFDNLRRSIVPISLLILIFLGLTIFPGSSVVWIGFAILTIAFPIIADMADVVLLKSKSEGRNYTVYSGFLNVLCQIILMAVFLPYKAYTMIDAISKTFFRLCITGKKLLEWETAADAESRLKNDISSFFIRMAVSPICAVLLVILVIHFSPSNLLSGVIFAVIWGASPYAACWLSIPYEYNLPVLSQEDITKLRRIARETWRYFEDFATDKDNYLPPDNYQEDPPRGAAHRTSSTNIGLLLSSILGARDMGYICTTDMIDSLERVFESMEKLDKWKGHFFNWYDTVTLQPLRPLYVSTVDSGNLVGYIMVLKEGIEEYLSKPFVCREILEGLLDTIRLFNEDLLNKNRDLKALDTSSLEDVILQGHIGIKEWIDLLDSIVTEIKKYDNMNSPWKDKTTASINMIKGEILTVYEWVMLLDSIPGPLKTPGESASKFTSIINSYESASSIKALPDIYNSSFKDINELVLSAGDDMLPYLKDFKSAVMNSYLAANKIISRAGILCEKAGDIVEHTQFTPLFDEKRQLFATGYNIEDERLDRSYYDLLASEERQTSFIAVAKGDVNQGHWFMMGRPLVSTGRMKGLASWSGTMFEYLMPLLVMKNYKNTLLDHTYRFVIKCQMEYGRLRHVPWGVSESGFNAFDIALNYQYRAFGVPKLGFKRGLVNDMVVAPYASVLALMVDPASAVKNIDTLISEGVEGPYGLYEAIDYTPSRLPAGKSGVIVKSFMAHHLGMSMLAIDNILNMNIMQDRFHRNTLVKSAQLLLQEKVPERMILTKDYGEEVSPLERSEKKPDIHPRVIDSPVLDFPEAHIISNGNYSVVLTNSGTGYSKMGDTFINRWRDDMVLDTSGMFFYIRNVNSNMIWSAAFEPCRVTPEEYRAVFSPDRVEYERVDGNIDTHTEISVSSEDNAEVRRISITNHSDHYRVLEVTSFFEPVISSLSSDIAHPAFNKLFVKTEFVPEGDILLARRRPREKGQKTVWIFHTVSVEGESVGGVQFETDRMKFIGRNGSLADPASMDIDRPLSGTTGAVLDPVMSIRKRVRVQPGGTVIISYTTGIADHRIDAVSLARKYGDDRSVNRVFDMAAIRSDVEQRYLNLQENDLELYQNLLSHIIYMSPSKRIYEDLISKNVKGQPGLWPYGISGDLPIILASVREADELGIIEDVIKLHEYWRLKGFTVDLVILNEYEGGYIQSLQDMISDMISRSTASSMRDRYGGIYLLQSSTIPEEDKNLLYAAARVVLKGDCGPIANQIKYRADEISMPDKKEYPEAHHIYSEESEPLPELLFFNDTGGFNKDGSEYVIYLRNKKHTPVPWSNVISNDRFGFLITESGGGYTWSENSRENKLTPWSNDPVADPSGEVIYLRDEDDGSVWTITPSPVREDSAYIIRHGFGYSIFEHISHGLRQTMNLFVPEDDSIKIYDIDLENSSAGSRNISLTLYIRPVLGVSEWITSRFIASRMDERSKVLLLKNTYSDDFPGRTAFVGCSEAISSFTCDREEFIGMGRGLDSPAALEREKLSGRSGTGFDPCGAVQVSINLNPGDKRKIVFTLGESDNDTSAVDTALKYRDTEVVKTSFDEAKEYWRRITGVVNVSTPDTSLDMLANGWLLYQTISCRIKGRSAFYQSGGAFGFRDQLQDSMASLYGDPEISRHQIISISAHQFLEGDVQHWYHPVTEKGIRTKFSDDLLWLPYVLTDYIDVTGDLSILDEMVPFLKGEPLEEDEDERYFRPEISQESGSVYEHCIRAIEKSLKFGIHGLPLMGSGDWNDGMNRVGNRGKGESVWLAWFMYSILKRFAPICSMKGDEERASGYLKTADDIAEAVEKNAWDGSWYLRAYFDNGAPLGSSANTECQIDSISQSWAAITGAGKASRVLEAMSAVERHLVEKDEGLIKLLSPPFDRSDLDPGYIESYLPGVRENGGQYTHAAVWVILGFIKMGMGDRAWELFHMINPINHSSTPMGNMRYKAEPYVIAADIYSAQPNSGRGGWTWYTGAAGWMYRTCVENLLGLKLRGDKVYIEPCIPAQWDHYSMKYRYKDTTYSIYVKNPYGVNTGTRCIYLDSTLIKEGFIPLVDDGREHRLDVTLG